MCVCVCDICQIPHIFRRKHYPCIRKTSYEFMKSCKLKISKIKYWSFLSSFTLKVPRASGPKPYSGDSVGAPSPIE